MTQRVIYEVPNPGYARRLRTLLANEDYGPKLVRLPAKDQQSILRLINDNRGRDARREIERLDTERRKRIARQPARAAARAARPNLRAAVAHVMELDRASVHGKGGHGFYWPADQDNVRDNLNTAAQPKALRDIPTMSVDEYKTLASEQTPSRVRPDYIKKGSNVNPFWYH